MHSGGVFAVNSLTCCPPFFFHNFPLVTVNSVFIFAWLQGMIGGQAKQLINIIRKMLFKVNTKRFKQTYTTYGFHGKEVGFQLMNHCCD